MAEFFNSPLFTWLVLPLLIFIARIADMSLDTMRIIMVGQGQKFYATLVAFCEVCIWLLVARQVITHLPNIACFFAYAGGFAAGNYVGLCLEERLAVGVRMIRIVVPQEGTAVMDALKKAGFGVTFVNAHGAKGPVHVIYSVVKRNEVKRAVALIEGAAPKAFITVEDIKQVSSGVFPTVHR